MRSKSPELMDKIKTYVDRFYCDRAVYPSMGDIANELGISRATSYRYLKAMDDNGMLSYDSHSRSIITKKTGQFLGDIDLTPTPIFGVIPCGTPEEEEENVEGYVRLPVSLFGRGEFYILRASGDSMTDARIEDGDLIVIKKQSTAEVGDIVVALDENGSSTLKRYGGIDEESHAAVLLYQNQNKYPDKRILVRELIVQGVAKKVLVDL